MNNVTNIPTEAGQLRVWEEHGGSWAWATPNGSQGAEDSFEGAVSAAFHAEGLKPAQYGYEDREATP